MTNSTLEKQGGFLSRMFNKITAPVREYIAEIKEDLEDSRLLKLWEDEEKINNIIFELGGISNQYDLEKKLKEKAKEQNIIIKNTVKTHSPTGQVSVPISKIIEHYKTFSENEVKLLANQNNNISQAKRNEFDKIQTNAWHETPEYKASYKKKRQGQIDHIINNRIDEDLSLMSDKEKLVLFEYQIQRTGLYNEDVTPHEILNRYDQIGQKEKHFIDLEIGDIEKYKNMTARLKPALPSNESNPVLGIEEKRQLEISGTIENIFLHFGDKQWENEIDTQTEREFVKKHINEVLNNDNIRQEYQQWGTITESDLLTHFDNMSTGEKSELLQARVDWLEHRVENLGERAQPQVKNTMENVPV